VLIVKQGVAVNADRSVEIQLKDFNQNISKVNFTLKHNPVVAETPLLSASGKPYESELFENTLKVTVKQCIGDKTEPKLWSNNKSTSIVPAYYGSNQQIFLLNLKTTLPDSITTCQGTIRFNFRDRIPSETEYKYYSDLMDVEFPKTIAIRYSLS
jgi:hypothetical protein